MCQFTTLDNLTVHFTYGSYGDLDILRPQSKAKQEAGQRPPFILKSEVHRV